MDVLQNTEDRNVFVLLRRYLKWLLKTNSNKYKIKNCNPVLAQEIVLYHFLLLKNSMALVQSNKEAKQWN